MEAGFVRLKIDLMGATPCPKRKRRTDQQDRHQAYRLHRHIKRCRPRQ
jgi:hypothetical protein